MKETKRPMHVLVVDDNDVLRPLTVLTVKQSLSLHVDEADFPNAARSAAFSQRFDVILFGHSEWMAGVQLYIDLLNKYEDPFQFIMFMKDPKELAPNFTKDIVAVRKPNIDELIAAVKWDENL